MSEHPPPPPGHGSSSPTQAVVIGQGGSGGEPPRVGRGLEIAIAVAAVIVLIGGIVAASVIALDVVDVDLGPAATDQPSTTPPDRSRDDPSDVALDDVLTLIDQSEVTMLQFQRNAERAPDAAGVQKAGETAAAELRRIGSELDDVDVQGSYAVAVRAVRDTYLAHLEAWERYAAATAEDPSALLDEAGLYWEDIGATADEFVAAIENDLPEDAPADLRDFAKFILDRGFRGEPQGTLV